MSSPIEPAEFDSEELIRTWLNQAAEIGASDLHLVAGYPPILRLNGSLEHMRIKLLSADFLQAALMPFCPEQFLPKLQSDKNIDFALQLDQEDRPRRFRANYFITGRNLGACFRVIPQVIPDFEWAGFPREVAEQLAGFRNGLVLLTGVTGAGKTTTLAMIINLLNQKGGYRIITVEEPIEYVFPKTSRSVVTQREVGQDVRTFADGLKYGLRQDPDIILVGEIRDRETGQMALSAAETGHLVFSTLHTRDVKGAISRYADLFAQSVQDEIRSQLSLSLRAIISQHLLPGANARRKRELALEILFNNSAIAHAIRTGKIANIDTSIVTGRAEGMVTLDDSIKRLLQVGKISPATAEHYLTDKALLWR